MAALGGNGAAPQVCTHSAAAAVEHTARASRHPPIRLILQFMKVTSGVGL